MNKSQLIHRVCLKIYDPNEKNYKKNMEATEEAVNIFFNSIRSALKIGDRAEIRGLGSFSTRKYKPYLGRNPRTGKKVHVEAKKVPFFKIGKHLKQIVNEKQTTGEKQTANESS